MSEDNSNDVVEYQPIPNAPGYRVGSDGSVWSLWSRNGRGLDPRRNWRRLVPLRSARGYLSQRIKYKGRAATILLHRLVLEGFVGPKPTGYECRHLNGKRDDNRLENLAWGTMAENVNDKREHGTIASGERCGSARLSRDDVREIRRLKAAGVAANDLGRLFGVHPTHVFCIVRRARWACVD